MYEKRWFKLLIATILIFLLILLFSQTKFVFSPILNYVGAVAVPILGAGILYYVTSPIVNLLEKLKIGRIVSILLVFLMLTGLVALFVLYIAPIVQNQFNNLIGNIPKMVRTAENLINDFQSEQLAIPKQIQDGIDQFMSNIQTHAENIVGSLFGFIANLVTFIFSLILIPFFLFFMLKDGDKLIPFITQAFDEKKSKNIRELLEKIDDTLTAFIQGQLIVSVILGFLLFIGYSIIGLKYSLTLALFGMVMNVIPFLGPFLAVIPALIVGAFQDWMMVIWVAVITLIAQQFESNFISPNVMGKKLALHPLTVITVILAAGSIGGFIGILFAVPLYAVIKTIYVHFYSMYSQSKIMYEENIK